ncbi:unnamed protein product [Urochloa decumbens]|uniref:F-box domain-containing protein n=1 Tax=Urochloa decumbens TaxID=240449 RepID=A0ABC8Z8C8_9POAL
MERQEPPSMISMEAMLHSMASLGMDAEMVNPFVDLMYGLLRTFLPRPPVSAAAYLSADSSSPGGGSEDRLSALPNAILRDIVSRLPVKDAARTAVLSSRWRPLWRSAPLALVDAHLVQSAGRAGSGDSPLRAGSSSVAAAVSRILEAHRGPFRCVNLTRSSMAAHPVELALWLDLLAAKGVEEFVFVNRPWPLDFPLPATIFSLASVKRLYLGAWRFPNTSALPRGTAFPHLLELGLGYVAMEDSDYAFILARSPVLETLLVYMCLGHVNLRIISRRLRCLQLYMCNVHDVSVVDGPCLERILLWEASDDCPLAHDREICTRIKFGHAPKLRILGYLVPGVHVLEVGNTIIKVETKASPRTIVPSVRILGLQVHFEVQNEAKMIPSFLKCFPNIETLHIKSEKSDEPAGKLSQKFWQEASGIECVQSHIREVVFHEYSGEPSELAFLKFILENAQVLRKMLVVFVQGILSSPTSGDDAGAKLMQDLSSVKMANENCRLVILKSSIPRGGACWNLELPSSI